MKTCIGCDKLIIDYLSGLTQFFCTIRKEYVFRTLDNVTEFPAPLDCDYEK